MLVRLANLTVPRKPPRSRRIYHDPLGSAASAEEGLGLQRVTDSDLAGLRGLHATVVALVDGLLAGRPIGAQASCLSDLAAGSTACVRLTAGEREPLRAELQWTDPGPVATLARQVICELVAIEPARLRRCARAECGLLFYDTTRSNTRRWHAESPCGLRERQQRHRTRHAVPDPPHGAPAPGRRLRSSN